MPTEYLVLSRKLLRKFKFTSVAAVSLLALTADSAHAQELSAAIRNNALMGAPMTMDAPTIASLAERARSRGSVRVIASVAIPPAVQPSSVDAAEITRLTAEVTSLASRLGAETAEPIGDAPLAVLELTEAQLAELVQAGVVSNVTEDIPEPPTLTDSIPLINADVAVALGADGEGQTIAILDTGVETAHSFFGGRVVAEACFSTNSTVSGSVSVCPGGVTSSTSPGSGAPCGHPRCDHGTHVAGIAGGQDATRSGVAPAATFAAVQVFSLFTDSLGGPQSCANAGTSSPCVLTFRSDQIRGLQQVLDWRDDFTFAAVNMSLGGGDFTTCDSDSRKAFIDQLRGDSIATVISSGNDGLDDGVGAPGCITTALTVGNTTKSDDVRGSSNSAPVVDMLAPGTSITSSIVGNGFGPKSGTSMAAPHVAGAVAALKSVRTDLSVGQIEQALESTGIPITDPKNGLVRPRIDVAAAVQSVLTPIWTGAVWQHTGTPCNGDNCPGWTRLDNNSRTVSVAAGDSLYQLHSNGAIWRHTGTPCNGDSCPGWTRLDNNPKSIAIAAGGSNLYQLHRNGSIWRSTGAACNGNSCPGWVRLDNNPMSVAIAADGSDFYQLHRNGAIWRSTGAACNGNSCPGWVRLDNNPSSIAIAAAGGNLYQLHRSGAIWRHTGTACNGNSCPGWVRLDNNPMGVAIAAAGGNLYQLHRSGAIWRHTGTACNGDSCPGWVRLDNNPMSIAIVAGGNNLYQLHRDGTVWRHNGTACNGDSCPGWVRLDNNPRTNAIVAAGSALYQLHGSGLAQRHENGRTWQSTGHLCKGDGCGGWQMVDNNPRTIAVDASAGRVYQLHDTGRIWRATGRPCQGESCPGWQMLDNNPATRSITAGGGNIYQLHENGRIWRSTGQACQGESCPGWQMLDNNPATQAIAAAGQHLYQLHSNGQIWRSTGQACQGNSCPGWARLDNNPATRTIAAGGGNLYQLHENGRIWRSTGQACNGNSCPGWQMLDNNPRTAAIAAAGGNLYQLHENGRIWRSTGQACQGNSCPGWQMLDNNPRTSALDAAGGQLYQLHDTGRIWRSTGAPCQDGVCGGWQLLDNNPQTRAIVSHQAE